MKVLFAVPFDQYKSSKTDQGVIYNLIDENGVIHIQCWVAHRPYADHDLHIKQMSSAPSNVRNELSSQLNDMFGFELWNVSCRFSIESVRKSSRLQTTNFTDQCKSILYIDKDKKIVVRDAQKVSIGGLTY